MIKGLSTPTNKIEYTFDAFNKYERIQFTLELPSINSNTLLDITVSFVSFNNDSFWRNWFCKQLQNWKYLIPLALTKFSLRCLNVLQTPLSFQLLNQFVSSGIFPQIFKTACVVLNHKKGSKLKLGNCCPISFLSSVSKVLEKIIHSQRINHFNLHDILSNLQHGFRKNHYKAIMELLYNEIDKHNKVLAF